MKDLQNTYFPTVKAIKSAAEKLQGIASISPLEEHQRLINTIIVKMLFKREDLQQVRSYKIRGAYNKISSLTKEETKNGIVCASAGKPCSRRCFIMPTFKNQRKRYLCLHQRQIKRLNRLKCLEKSL